MDLIDKPAIARSLFVYALLYGGMTVIAGVLGFKQVALGPLAVESGIFAFLILVILSSAVAELHGREIANKLVLWGFLPLLSSMALIALVLQLPAAQTMPADWLAAFDTVLSQNLRIMAAGPLAYGVSQMLNVAIFSRLRGAGDGGSLWLMIRGGIASALSQVVDTLIFITVAFWGEFPIAPLLAGQMMAKVVLSLVLVPFLIQFAVALGRHLDRRIFL